MIRLKCVKENGKLRVKIISAGYSSDANCQFPRDIRVENREYSVPKSDVKFSEMGCKFFYRIGRKNIQIIDVAYKCEDLSQKFKGMKIYGEQDLNECCICMTDASNDSSIQFVIFAPCGHYCCCSQCSNKVEYCPLCRTLIEHVVTKDQL